ncbi:myo-inositol-1-phosphate synthase [Streptomyces alfalfae]|uniref:Myo-inositol-1-phosphate synthase n=1 Tax=Streptomyces alfalfae TaxID=1642299 RepID=A0ABM6GNN5_9ACTN|nr:inositol-3-phosphate synthase [Streptomyces alfalfae]APY85316.1 myo-inositol-1-phosphate synthase [Streptomyces alfalfae]AYA15660.1 myo-inositol-1-phosphate synthase [Streptomyces fradiae]RXX39136.1 myo-inositol-1-phosphate synthase [Streptomyces alfalfae]RZM99252.1 myo-inositol-1-phosphate synthase [Streptomyces alfalfae]
MSTSALSPSPVGVWLIGARGSVATTAVAGCAAVAAGLHPPVGMVTETPPFADCGLPTLSSLVFGGHDTANCPLPKRAEELAAGGVLPHGLPAAVRAELTAADAEIRPGGPLPGDTRTDEELITAFAHDLRDFTHRRGLARTVVVNVASTEPLGAGAGGVDGTGGGRAGAAASRGGVASADRGVGSRGGGEYSAGGSGDGDGGVGGAGDGGGARRRLPASSLYAAAALRADCPYVNFTPSTGLHHPGLAEAALAAGLPHAGRDGKTGQTLLRSVLGPMFAQRALAVRAWSGTNLLGGGDGAALADPAAAAAKNAGKERVLADTLGAAPEGQVHIDDVPSLGDWKTAWDHIAFDGFLGARMVLQTTWQGCDSALAAPLILDLARLTARAHECGVAGPLPELAFYFKDPDAGAPAALGEQHTALLGLADRFRDAR